MCLGSAAPEMHCWHSSAPPSYGSASAQETPRAHCAPSVSLRSQCAASAGFTWRWQYIPSPGANPASIKWTQNSKCHCLNSRCWPCDSCRRPLKARTHIQLCAGTTSKSMLGSESCKICRLYRMQPPRLASQPRLATFLINTDSVAVQWRYAMQTDHLIGLTI